MFSLQGHAALVTGGTQGVGAAIARSLARAGADLILHGLRIDDHAMATQSDCRQLGVNCEVVTADLSVPAKDCIPQLFQQVIQLNPRVNLLANNAGTFVDEPFLHMEYETYDRTMRLNVASGFFLTQAFAKYWISQGIAGRVIFTGSINGQLAEPDHTAYDTSKGAVNMMVRSLCVALAPHQIRVNAIAPGLVRTPLTSTVLDKRPDLVRWMKLHTPNQELPKADVCGPAAVFLLSDEASHVHGQTLLVDGGMSVWQQPDPPPGF